MHNNIPVHSTGAAIDIRLWDTKNEQFVDMGSFGVIWGVNASAPTFSEDLTDEQKSNRLFALIAATQAGLVNYSYEYWHFSYGDRYASFWKKKSYKKAMYGPVGGKIKGSAVKHLKKDQATKVDISSTCTVWEYETGNTEINTALVALNGRYPEHGWAINEKCTEMAFIVTGTGTLTTATKTVSLAEGDVVLIPAGEKLFWDGHMTMVVPVAPAWYPEQHKKVEQ